MTPSSGLIMAHRMQGSPYLHLLVDYKGILSGNSQMEEGKVGGKGEEPPCSHQMQPPPSTFTFANPDALQAPKFQIFMENSSYRHDRSLIPFPASLLFPEERKVQPSHRGLVLGVTSPHRGAHPESPF